MLLAQFLIGTKAAGGALLPSLCAGRARFTQADDRLVLEDEGARVALAGPASPVGECVTGEYMWCRWQRLGPAAGCKCMGWVGLG